MDTLIRRYKRLLTATSTTYIRSLMNTINWDNRLIAIRGARGVGKTTLMLQYLKLHYANDSQSALYTSLDSLYFTQHSLSELAEQFYLKGGKCLFLDEVHKYPSWSKEIKIYMMSFLNWKIVTACRCLRFRTERKPLSGRRSSGVDVSYFVVAGEAGSRTESTSFRSVFTIGFVPFWNGFCRYRDKTFIIMEKIKVANKYQKSYRSIEQVLN